MIQRYSGVSQPVFLATLSERERFFVFAGIFVAIFATMTALSNTAEVVLLVLIPLAGLGYFGFYQLNLLIHTATSLKQSEERFRLLVDEVSNYAIFAVSQIGNVVSWNAGAAQITGYASGEILDQPLTTLQYADKNSDCDIKEVLKLATLQGRFEEEIWRLRKDGTRYLSNTVITPLVASTQELRGFSIIMCDVTAKWKAEQELLASHQFIQRINDTIPNILFIYELTSLEKIYLNREAAIMLGYTEAAVELMGVSFFEHILHPEDLVPFQEQMERCAQQKPGETLESEFRMKHANGEWRLGYCRSVVFTRKKDNKSDQILGIIQDVTALSRAREHVLQLELEAVSKQRLALVGELSAGVAHELRNPLMGLQHCLEDLRCYCEDDAGALSTINLLEEGLRRMDHISGRLLRLARLEDGERTPSDVGQCIQISCAFIQARAVKSGISIHMEIQPDMPPVTMHAQRISEALLNLLNNAIDACKPDRTITVSAGIYPERKDMLDIRVSDNGTGIPTDIQEKIFTAFFTTKPFGKGTGLGMTIVKKIVEAHAGTIEIMDSKIGTTFRMLIPLEFPVVPGAAQ